MTAPAAARCFHHAARPAAARCPECRRPFCRECVTEHRGRVLCLDCLTRLTAASRPRSPGWIAVGWTLRALAGLVLVWLWFIALGRFLVRLPAAVHDGSYLLWP